MRRLGGKEMMEFIRLLPMGAKRLLDEHFENEELKGLLVVPAIKDLLQGPRAAGTAFNLMYQKMGSSNGSFRKAQTFKGGNGALLEALRKKCESQGIDFLMGKKGYKVRIKDYAATGVRLNNGEEISSKLVLSGLEARKTFLDFVGPTNLEPRFVQRLLNYKLRGSTASIHLALNGLPDFTSATNNDQLSGSIIICPSTDYAEKAFDAAKYGESSSHPVLEARIPSLLDAGLAPDGKHTMSIHYRYAPYDLRGESWDSKKKRISKTTLKLLEDYAPGFSDLVLDSVVIPPKDYEDEYDLTEGSMSQGQMGLDQLLLMRPVPGFSGYLSPVDALYLGSSSSHPGGRGSAMPGWNAADQIIREI